MSLSRHILRSTVVAGLTATAVAGIAMTADAHVTVNPDSAEQGSFAKLTFRVPNERDAAKTTKLEVDLPLDHPVTSVSVRPLPGWTAKVEKKKLPAPVKSGDVMITEAVSAITWSGGAIDPDQFQEFDLSMGPLPTDTTKMMFTAVQTYSGGEVVRWDQETKSGQEEPEHPAPVLNLTPKGSGGGEHSDEGMPPGAPGSTVAVRNTASSSSADDGTARLLGAAGIVIGVIGVGVGTYGLRRGRSQG
jgi:uncharacterized protein YcnI